MDRSKPVDVWLAARPGAATDGALSVVGVGAPQADRDAAAAHAKASIAQEAGPLFEQLVRPSAGAHPPVAEQLRQQTTP